MTLSPTPLWKAARRLLLLAMLCAGAAYAQPVLNLYSARHYPSDEALYQDFTASTGIRINRVDADDAGIIARLKAEGSASVADVILLVDAARLWRGEVDGLFLPVRSTTLEAAVAPHLRAKPDAQNATAWFGLSTRARILVYDKSKVAPADVQSYEQLANPVNRGRICVRSGSHPYNLSLFGAMMEHLGPASTERWLQGVVSNLARPPRGGDTDQIRGVTSGECAIALTNTYYLARLLRSSQASEREAAQKLGVSFPNQQSWGTHMNIAGGAVARHTRQPQLALRFLEYLVSAQAQAHFANGNNEWPVLPSLRLSNPALEAMAPAGFKRETLPTSAVGMNQIKVQQMLDRVGFK